MCYNALSWRNRYGYGEFECDCGTHFVCKDRFWLGKKFPCPECTTVIMPFNIWPSFRKPKESETRYQSTKGIRITEDVKRRKPRSSSSKAPQSNQFPKTKPQTQEPENTEMSQSTMEIISFMRKYSPEAATTSAPTKRGKTSQSKEKEEAQSQPIPKTSQPIAKQPIITSKPEKTTFADVLIKYESKTSSAAGEKKLPETNDPTPPKSKYQIKKERELRRKTKKKKVYKETKSKRSKPDVNTAQNKGTCTKNGDANKWSPTASQFQALLPQPCIEIPPMPESKPPLVGESFPSISGHPIISSSASHLPTGETTPSTESALEALGLHQKLLPTEKIAHVVVSTPTQNIPQDQPLQRATAPGSSDAESMPSCTSYNNDLIQQAKKIVCRALLKAILNIPKSAVEKDLASTQMNNESLTSDATTNHDTHTCGKEHHLHTGVEWFPMDIPAMSSETDMQPTFMPLVSPIDKVTLYGTVQSDQETSDSVLSSPVAHLAVNTDSTDAIHSESSHQVESAQSEDQKQQQPLGNECLPYENMSILVPSTQNNIHESDAGNAKAHEVTGSIQTNTTHYVSPITQNQHSFTTKPETESPLQVVNDVSLASEENDTSNKHVFDQQQINTEDHHICADTEVGKQSTTDLKSHQACITDSSSPYLHSKLVAASGTINHELTTQAPSKVCPDGGKKSEGRDITIPLNSDESSYSATHQTPEAASLDFEHSKQKNVDTANSNPINSSLDMAQSSVPNPTLGDHTGLRDQEAREEVEVAPSVSNAPTVNKETEASAQEQALQQLSTTTEGCQKVSKALPSTLEDSELTEAFALQQFMQSSQKENAENLSQTADEDVPPNHGGYSTSPDHSGIAATLPPKVDSTTPAMSESHNGDTKFTQQAKEEDRGEAVKESLIDLNCSKQ